jgi:hypothetical protein
MFKEEQMKLSPNIVFITLLMVMLSACGGSSDSGTGPTTPIPEVPTTRSPSEVIADVASQSPNALRLAAGTLADQKYVGSNANATMDIQSTQTAFINLLSRSRGILPRVLTSHIFDNSISFPAELADNYFCTSDDDRIDRGLIRYTGSLDRDGSGRLFIELTNCLLPGNSHRINGNASIILSGKARLFARPTSSLVYYDNVNWESEGKQYSVSGYSTELQRTTQLDTFFDISEYFAFTVDDKTFLIDSLTERLASNDIFFGGGDLTVGYSGDYSDDNYGKVSFTVEDGAEPNGAQDFGRGQFTLTGNNTVSLLFAINRIQYLEDNNNDGVFDRGTYFRGYDDLVATDDISDNIVVDIDLLSLPPTITGLEVLFPANIFTNTPISATENNVRDDDTPLEQLDISYMWYINDVLVEGVSGSTLPAFSTAVGDAVSVSMVVSDSSNTIRSQRSSPAIVNNRPVEFDEASVPETVNAGEISEFAPQMFDPDNEDPNSPITTLLSGPSGASIDENGLVTWSVPQNNFVPFRTFTFIFALPSVGDIEPEEIAVDIKVSGDISDPIVKSGSISPTNGFSMSVGDYTGDGKNEILTTDNESTISLLKYENRQYTQAWVYPYLIASSDNKILQVLGHNVDDDLPLEIIVVTENTIGLIDGLNKTMIVLYETDKIIQKVAIDDIDQDGIADLAFFSREGSYGDLSLYTIALDGTDLIAIEQPLEDVENVGRIIFGNVDDDPQLELIDNRGLVFDTSDWSVQWVYESGFGGGTIDTSDFNLDGVEEIVTMGGGGLSAYSAPEKRKIGNVPIFNSTEYALTDVDGDNIKEIITNNDVEDAFYIHKFDGLTFTEYSVVDNPHVQINSMIGGDADNDGDEEVIYVNNGIHVDSFDGGDILLDEKSFIPQRSDYFPVGWDTMQNGQDNAVFFFGSAVIFPKAGASIGLLSGDGEFTFSDIIVNGTRDLKISALNDFNKDGITDIFLPDNMDGNEQGHVAVDLLNFASQWQETTADITNNIEFTTAVDVNGDTFEDAIYIDGQGSRDRGSNSRMKVFDAQNSSLITTYLFDSRVIDIVTHAADGNSGLLVATETHLVYLQFIEGQYVESARIEVKCNKVEWINIDENPDLELFCLQQPRPSFKQDLILYELNDTSFTELRRFELEGRLFDIKVDPSTTQQQNLIISLEVFDDSEQFPTTFPPTIAKYDNYGNKIWNSPTLAGEHERHGLVVRLGNNGLEILVITDSVMYWFK